MSLCVFDILGYGAPGRKAVSTALLNDEVTSLKQRLDKHTNGTDITQLGATLISDGWSNVQNRPIINFLLITGGEVLFVDAIDTSGATKDAKYIFNLLCEQIERVGAEKICQIVTDSASNCVAARRMTSDKYPSITCSPCAAHCLDLLLEDISKLPWINPVIAQGRDIVKFLTGHHASIACYRNHSTLELLKPGETRFATSFIMLQRLIECKDQLQETVVSREYKRWLADTTYKLKGLALSETILRGSFWDNAQQVSDICSPIVSLLRMTDGSLPTVGKIYWKMFKIDNDVQQSNMSAVNKTEIRALIAKRWAMLHTDLHAAGFVLDPEYQSFLQHENEEVMNGFHNVVERIHSGDVASQVKAIQQHAVYRSGQGLFSRPMAVAAAKEMSGHRWWLSFGAHVPELQKVAIRVLSQVASAAACERNWSTFEFIHTKKRNRLACSRVKDIVYVHCNLRLADKLQEVNREDECVEWSSDDE